MSDVIALFAMFAKVSNETVYTTLTYRLKVHTKNGKFNYLYHAGQVDQAVYIKVHKVCDGHVKSHSWVMVCLCTCWSLRSEWLLHIEVNKLQRYYDLSLGTFSYYAAKGLFGRGSISKD